MAIDSKLRYRNDTNSLINYFDMTDLSKIDITNSKRIQINGDKILPAITQVSRYVSSVPARLGKGQGAK